MEVVLVHLCQKFLRHWLLRCSSDEVVYLCGSEFLISVVGVWGVQIPAFVLFLFSFRFGSLSSGT